MEVMENGDAKVKAKLPCCTPCFALLGGQNA